MLDFIGFISYGLHRFSSDKLDSVTLISPKKSPRLRVHILRFDSIIILTSNDFQVSAVHIDSIVSHTFIQTIYRAYFSFTSREMGSIGLSSEKTFAPLLYRYSKLIKSHIFSELSQQPHPLYVVYCDIFKSYIFAFGYENSRCRSGISTQHKALTYL